MKKCHFDAMIEPDTSGGKILCFTVPSRSQKDVLRHVDLCDDSCDCEDWLWRKSDAAGVSKEQRRCWHIRQARDYLLDKVIEDFGKSMGRKFE